jgi:hypothetical protein
MSITLLDMTAEELARDLNKRLRRSRIRVLGGRNFSPLAVHVDAIPRDQLLTVVRVLAALLDEPIDPKPSARQDHPSGDHSQRSSFATAHSPAAVSLDIHLPQPRPLDRL